MKLQFIVGRYVILDDGGNCVTFHELNIRIKIEEKYCDIYTFAILLNRYIDHSLFRVWHL